MLRLEEVSLSLGAFRLKDISMNVKQGEYLVVLGLTGAGKTVLLETVAGLNRPDQGKIFLKGQDVTSLPPEARHMGIVYQDYALFPHLTVYGNISFGLRLTGESGKSVRRIVEDTAGYLGIGHLLNRRPRHLSGGECQRVALARVLALKTHMLLLDEPLSALDCATKDRLRRELKRIHLEIGITILHITHDLSEAFYLADRLVVMQDGSIIQEGLPEDILKRPANRFVAELIGITNFIPGRAGEGGRIYLEDLGDADPSLLSMEPVDKLDEFFLTVPAGSVLLMPHETAGLCLWKGMMRIVNLNHTAEYTEVELEYKQGKYLRTSLSLRELSSLPVNLDVDMELEVGLLGDKLHCIPRDEE